MGRTAPTSPVELQLCRLGRVAGVDEVGRGPLAGPVVAAAVMLPDNARMRAELVMLVRDSKSFAGHAQRVPVAALIRATCRVGIGQASVAEIDALNIRQATLLAMARAVAALPEVPAALLIDGRDVLPGQPMVQRAIIKGDATELAIASASVVAKVYRDELMQALARDHPGYGWERNVGYGAAVHLQGLRELGVTPQHRRSFAPVAVLLQKTAA